MLDIITFMDTFIAVDVGGTHLRAAVYPKTGIQHITHKKITTRSAQISAVDRIIQLITEIWPTNDTVKSIALAAPGFLNPKTGVVITAPNIDGWENIPLGEILKREFGVPVYLGNDANLAALGEWKFGAARGHHDVLYLTVSTGIGGGVIIADRLLTGSRGMATELGHITVLPDGPMCGCGHRGHLEAVASGTAIARDVAARLAAGEESIIATKNPTTKDIGLAAMKGDLLAISALSIAGQWIGYTLADFLHIFDPSIVIFGGGVSQVGSLLLNPVRQGLQERILSPEYLKGLTITTAALGDDAGLLGALALARTESQTG